MKSSVCTNNEITLTKQLSLSKSWFEAFTVVVHSIEMGTYNTVMVNHPRMYTVSRSGTETWKTAVISKTPVFEQNCPVHLFYERAKYIEISSNFNHI